MEQDEQLKQILLNSAEGAPASFTDAVMKRVNSLPADALYYQPLVSAKLQRIFLFTFGALVGVILCLCLIIASQGLHVANSVQSIALSLQKYHDVLLFIGTFWIVFSVNALLKKKMLRG